MKIIFDLDGTLICSKERLYKLFCFLVGSEELSYSKYWDLKFSGKTNQQILSSSFGFSTIEVQKFVDEWMDLIEADQYLVMDKVFDRVPDFLASLKENHNIYICTSRQSKSRVIKQLNFFDIFDLFDQVFVTEQRASKEQLLKSSDLNLSYEDWIVGDTGYDILTGKALGIKTCAVLSGFMSEARLISYQPDLILDNVTLIREKLL